MAGLLFFLIIKKELKELKIASILLASGIVGFILIFTGQLAFGGGQWNKDKSFDKYYKIDFDQTLVKSFSIVLVAFCL